MVDRLWQDVRYARRQIGRAPGFACAVVATLALAIGANTALFSLLNAIVLRTLPVREPERLVLLQATDDRGRNRPIYHTTYSELARLPVFETLTLYSSGGILLTEARGVLGEGGIEAVTPGFHETLGLRPFLGRFFTADESPVEGSPPPVAIISHRFWQQYYNADPRAIGETLRVSGTPVTIIGVTPPEYKGFYVDSGFGFSVPLAVLNRQLGTDPKRPVRGLNAVARLRTDVSLEQARAAVNTVWPTLRVEAVPAALSPTERQEIATQGINVESLATGFSGLRTEFGTSLGVVAGITGLLFLIGCVNLSSLLLARTAARDQQVAVRFALGASRGRIVQQVLVESLVLSLIGAAVAVPVAWWVAASSGALLWQSDAPFVLSLTPDARVLALTAAMAIGAGLLVGVLPAWTASRHQQIGLQPARTVAHTSGRWGKTLLVAQVAMSLVLLFGAGLFASSLTKLRRVDEGFRTDGIRWSRLFAVPGGYRNQNDAVYYPELVRELSTVPGVQSIALSGLFPQLFNLGRLVSLQPIARAEASGPTGAAEGMVENISPQFFDTVGIPLLQGRDFTWSDNAQHPPVAIINETLSRTLFRGDNAIGRRIRIGNDPARRAIEVIGIARDALISDVRSPNRSVAFRPRMQELGSARAPLMIVRTNTDPAVIDDALTKAIRSLGHEYPRRFFSMDEHLDRALIQERLLAGVSSFFGALAVLLAFVGLYGLLAFGVVRRTREIGVRMALGASRGGVLRMVMREGIIVTMLGVAIGIPCALAAGPLMRSLLYGLAPSDPTTLVATCAFFLVVGAVAGFLPAFRASSVDPVTALRAE